MMARASKRSEAEQALLARIFKKSEPAGWRGWFKAWLKKFIR
jgi:hypothetical protein